MKIQLLTVSEALADTWRSALGEARCWRVADVATVATSLQTGQTLLVDLAMPGLADANWDALCERGRVLAMSSVPHNEEGLAWLRRGAAGYAHAYSTPDLLQQIVTTVESGSSWVGRELLLLMCRQLGSHLPPPAAASWQHRVTGRETEVILALKQGRSNKEIARELAISERTVKAHLSNLFQKFGVEDRLQLLIKLA